MFINEAWGAVYDALKAPKFARDVHFIQVRFEFVSIFASAPSPTQEIVVLSHILNFWCRYQHLLYRLFGIPAVT